MINLTPAQEVQTPRSLGAVGLGRDLQFNVMEKARKAD